MDWKPFSQNLSITCNKNNLSHKHLNYNFKQTNFQDSVNDKPAYFSSLIFLSARCSVYASPSHKQTHTQQKITKIIACSSIFGDLCLRCTAMQAKHWSKTLDHRLWKQRRSVEENLKPVTEQNLNWAKLISRETLRSMVKRWMTICSGFNSDRLRESLRMKCKASYLIFKVHADIGFCPMRIDLISDYHEFYILTTSVSALWNSKLISKSVSEDISGIQLSQLFWYFQTLRANGLFKQLESQLIAINLSKKKSSTNWMKWG